MTLYPLAALPKKPLITLAGGLTLDVASFGIDEKYMSLQAGVQSKGLLSIGLKPLFSFNGSNHILRIPLIVGMKIRKIVPYAGVGIEFSSYSGDSSYLPYVTGGIQFFTEPLYFDIPISIVMHGNDPDTDIAFLAGIHF